MNIYLLLNIFNRIGAYLRPLVSYRLYTAIIRLKYFSFSAWQLACKNGMKLLVADKRPWYIYIYIYIYISVCAQFFIDVYMTTCAIVYVRIFTYMNKYEDVYVGIYMYI